MQRNATRAGIFGVLALAACEAPPPPRFPARSSAQATAAASDVPSAAAVASVPINVPSARHAEELAPDAPLVEASGNAVVLDGVEVASIRPVLDAGKLRKVDGLFTALKAK